MNRGPGVREQLVGILVEWGVNRGPRGREQLVGILVGIGGV